MREERILVRITGDATKATAPNGRPFKFSPLVTPGQVVDIVRDRKGVEALVSQGVAEKVKKNG